MSKAPRHFLDLNELPTEEAAQHPRRQRRHEGEAEGAREPSNEAARRQDAGDDLRKAVDPHPRVVRRRHAPARRQTIMLTGAEMQLGRGETIADTARVLSRYVDAIMIRMLNHDELLELAANATVPVINGLTRRSHPCQVMADVMTFEEHRGPIEGRTVAWTGDGNNVLASWVHAAARFDFKLERRDPAAARAEQGDKDWIKATKAPIVLGNDPEARCAAPIASSPTPGSRWATRTATTATIC